MKTLSIPTARFVVALWHPAARFTPRETPRSHKLWLAVLLALVSLWDANVASAQTMVGLGTLSGAPNSSSRANAVSADDLTVVGYSTNSQGFTEAFVWTAADGMKGLGTLADNVLHPYSNARAVSANGSIVVGDSINSQGDYEAFVWTAATGMVGLGVLPGAFFSGSFATGISRDGSTVVGTSTGYDLDDNYVEEGFIWTATTGMHGLGTLPLAASTNSVALGVSGNGSSVVGYSYGYDLDYNYVAEAFLWTADTGMVGLGTLAGAPVLDSTAYGVSADGLIIVGVSRSATSSQEAFILDLTPPDPADLIVDLIKEVVSINIQHGIENSLDSKLNAAFHALDGADAENNVAAIKALNAFINAVKAQSGKAIHTGDAGAMIDAAEKILGLLQ